ncbi:reverse transcriptase domain-containing protein [Pseudomonas sp. MAC6]|uniref:reverse transcriptase domain-containing protein n=1 Tax=Pseudomonas sp. MAC6 TaxID=3401633 RepID=UPI003BF576C5
MNKKKLEVLFEAMYHGKYSFKDFAESDISTEYTQFKVKERTIYRTTKKLKTFHSFISLFILEYLNINPRVVYSYRKGFNSLDAVSKHAQSKYFFQTDIEHFFENLTTPLIRKTILNNSENSPVLDIENYVERIVELTTLNNSLPLGFSSSPAMSNACLYDFDNELEKHCIQNELIYTRYSDDIIISSQNQEKIEPIESTIELILNKYHNGQLNLNKQKSKHTRKGNKVKLLGLAILPNGKVTIDIKIKNEIEVLLFHYVNNRDKFLDHEKIKQDMTKGVDLLFGYLNYVSTIDKDYLEKLRKKFGATVIDMFLHRTKKKEDRHANNF